MISLFPNTFNEKMCDQLLVCVLLLLLHTFLVYRYTCVHKIHIKAYTKHILGNVCVINFQVKIFLWSGTKTYILIMKILLGIFIIILESIFIIFIICKALVRYMVTYLCEV